MSIPPYFQTNAIYCGDCRDVLRKFPEESVDLIYLDPPFFSNRHYEVLWEDGYELRAFEDRWKGGVENYIAWMVDRLKECYRVLKPTGSLYLHCDWHASHHLKVALDDKGLFGITNFKNEIVWQRTKSHNDPKQYGRIHDTILFYAKTKDYTWNPQYLEYDDSYIEQAFKNEDEKGRYQTQPLHASKPGGDTSYEWKGQYPPKGRFWAFSKDHMEQMDKEGRIVYSRNGVPRYKIYVNDAKGRPLQDVWIDIPGMHQTGGDEKLGYPTQKPEALLSRIIKTSSNPNDIILDPFCGCGTALAVAQKLKRRWIGVDVSPTACNLMEKRLRSIGASPIMAGMPMTEADLRTITDTEFQNWAIRRLYGRISIRKSGDMGIDGYTFEGYPVQVKQSEDIGRNVIDNFETAMRRGKAKKGFIVAFSFGKGAYEEIARVKNHEDLDIELITVEELLKNRRDQTI
jgi:DNA modification methylase